MKKIDHTQLKVTGSIKLKEKPTKIEMDASEDKIKDELKDVRKKLGDWQDVLYAHHQYSVLICLQGMDTAGKDSLIR